MSLESEVLAAKGNGITLTYNQGRALFGLTGLKWWQPQTMPPANKLQASLIIGALIDWAKERKGDPRDIIETIQIWFPNFTDISAIHFRGGHRKAKEGEGEGEPQPQTEPETQPAPAPASSTGDLGYNPKGKGKGGGKGSATGGGSPKTAPDPDPVPAPSPVPAPKPSKPLPEAKGKGIDDIEFLVNAGIQNIWMVGPAGCGKTTICQTVGDRLGIPVTIIPCGAGTSATTFLGYKYPEREGSPFVHAFAQEGIIVLDEFTALESQVAQIVNGALANGELCATIGTYQRHERCFIIATSNTFGKGGDRQYVANQQLDASTIDRFAGGIVEIDYSREYESQFDPEVAQFVWNLREIVKTNGFREIVSTRAIIAACKLKAAGSKNWKESITTNWTKDEKACIR